VEGDSLRHEIKFNAARCGTRPGGNRPVALTVAEGESSYSFASLPMNVHCRSSDRRCGDVVEGRALVRPSHENTNVFPLRVCGEITRVLVMPTTLENVEGVGTG